MRQYWSDKYEKENRVSSNTNFEVMDLKTKNA